MWEISAFLIATEELQRWDGAVLGRDTVLCTALFQSWIHQDTGKYFLEKRVIKRKSLGMFYQECCLGRGSAWPGVSQPCLQPQLLQGFLHRLFGTELSWDVVTAHISTKSSALVFCSGVQR